MKKFIALTVLALSLQAPTADAGCGLFGGRVRAALSSVRGRAAERIMLRRAAVRGACAAGNCR